MVESKVRRRLRHGGFSGSTGAQCAGVSLARNGETAHTVRAEEGSCSIQDGSSGESDRMCNCKIDLDNMTRRVARNCRLDIEADKVIKRRAQGEYVTLAERSPKFSSTTTRMKYIISVGSYFNDIVHFPDNTVRAFTCTP